MQTKRVQAWQTLGCGVVRRFKPTQPGCQQPTTNSVAAPLTLSTFILRMVSVGARMTGLMSKPTLCRLHRTTCCTCSSTVLL